MHTINPVLYLIIVLEICVATLLWPEPLEAISILIALLIAFALIVVGNTYFLLTFMCSFLLASIMAFIIYHLSAPLGLFATSWQDPHMSDSQYYLYESHRFLSDHDMSALFSTWGSLVPVFYGSVALEIFGGHYLGIVFANCLLYSIAVFLSARILGIPKYNYRLLPLLGLLPLQGFYNSMLSKEPIYLFLVVSALYVFQLSISYKKVSWPHLAVFSLLEIVLIIFRPVGALIIGIIALFITIRNFGFNRMLFLLSIISAVSVAAIVFARNMDYFLPLFFLGKGYEVDFANQVHLLSADMASKSIPAGLAPLFSPPWSILASPLLGILWMVSPLPLLGKLADASTQFLLGTFSFSELAIVIRYLDAMVMFLLSLLFIIRVKIKRAIIFNPLVLFGVFQILGIVSFEFFESARHRYLPGVILAQLIILFSNRRNITSYGEHHAQWGS